MAKKPLTKSQIESKFAEKFGLKKNLAKEIVKYVADLAYKETRSAGVFTLPGIGKLVLSRRKARKGFNPATGEPINIPAKTVVKMRIAKACKEEILKK